MADGTSTLKNIWKNLWEMSNEENQVKEDKVEIEIKKEAGLDQRTIRRYKERLQEFGYAEREKGGLFTIKEPDYDTPEVKELTRTRIQVPKSVKETADALGLDKGAIFTDALLEEIDRKKEFLIEHGFDLDEREAEIVMRLVKQDLYHGTYSSDKEKKRVMKARGEIYLDVYEEKEKMRRIEEENRDDFTHLKNLRKKAFEVAEVLGHEKPPAEEL